MAADPATVGGGSARRGRRVRPGTGSNEPALGLDRRDYIRANYRVHRLFPGESWRRRRNTKPSGHSGIADEALRGRHAPATGAMSMDQYLPVPRSPGGGFPAGRRAWSPASPSAGPRTSPGSSPPGASGKCSAAVLGEQLPPTASTWAPADSWAPKRSLTPGYDAPASCTRRYGLLCRLHHRDQPAGAEKIAPDYFVFNEDLFDEESARSSAPEPLPTFIFPHLKRVVASAPPRHPKRLRGF